MTQKAKMLSLKIRHNGVLIHRSMRKAGLTTEVLMALAGIQHLRPLQQASLREVALVMVSAGETFPKMYALTTKAVKKANANKRKGAAGTTLYREAKRHISKGMAYLEDRKLVTFGRIGVYSLAQISLKRGSFGAYAIKHFDIKGCLTANAEEILSNEGPFRATFDKGLSRFGVILPSHGASIEMLCVLSILKDSFPEGRVPVPFIEQTLSQEDRLYKCLCPELLHQEDGFINDVPQNIRKALTALSSAGLLEKYAVGEYAMLRSNIDIEGMPLKEFVHRKGRTLMEQGTTADVREPSTQRSTQPTKDSTKDKVINPIHKCVLDILQQSPSIQIHTEQKTGKVEIHITTKAF